MEFEIEIINPAKYPELAAQQVVIELIRAGKIDNSFNGVKVFNTYQHLVEKYKAMMEGTSIELMGVARSAVDSKEKVTKVLPTVKAPMVEQAVAAETVAKAKKAKPNPVVKKK